MPERRNAGILKPRTLEYLNLERWNTKTQNTQEYLNPERWNTETRNARILKPGTPEYLNPERRNTLTLNDRFNVHKMAEKTNN